MSINKIIKDWRAMNITDKLLILFVLFIPIMRVPSLPIVKQKIQYSDLIFSILFSVWLFRFLRGKVVVKKTTPLFSAVFLLIVFLLSTIHSMNWKVSCLEFLGIIYLVSVYFMLVQLVSEEAEWFRLTRVWVACSFIFSVTAIAAYILHLFGFQCSFLMVKHDVLFCADPRLMYRVNSVFRHPNMFAAYLHVSAVFCFILAAKTRNTIERNYAWLSLIACILAAFLTKSRIIAGIAITIFIILTVFPMKNKIISLAKYISLIFSIILVAFVFFATVWWIFPIKIYTNTEKETAAVEINFLENPYFINNRAYVRIIRDHPLLGIGPGMYNYESIKYISWKESEKSWKLVMPDLTEKENDRYRQGKDPHSTYLGWGAETGLLGVLGMLVFFIQVIYLILKTIRAESDRIKIFILEAMLAGLAGFFFNAWYIDILTMRHLWFLVAMAIALTLINKKTAQ